MVDMAQPVEKIAPDSLVARIVADLEANPAAKALLLRALLTGEFRGMPVRLEGIEAELREMRVDVTRLKVDVTQLKVDVRQLKIDVAQLKIDVAELKGDNLEFHLPQRIKPFLSQKLGLRRVRILQSALCCVVDPDDELDESVATAAETGVITDAEETRILTTDLILRAQRSADRATVWVAVEASCAIDGYDLDRARESADILRRVFGADAVAAAVGYGVRAGERAHAEALGVEVFEVERRRAA